MQTIFTTLNLTYAQWDMIADSYIPLLVLLCLACIMCTLRAHGKHTGGQRFGCCLAGVIIVYGWMYLDILTGAFPYFAIDFSTHTALSLWLVMWLAMSLGLPPTQITIARITLAMSFVVYLELMRFQNYHTYPDMLATALLVGTSNAVLLYFFFKRSARVSPIHSSTAHEH